MREQVELAKRFWLVGVFLVLLSGGGGIVGQAASSALSHWFGIDVGGPQPAAFMDRLDVLQQSVDAITDAMALDARIGRAKDKEAWTIGMEEDAWRYATESLRQHVPEFRPPNVRQIQRDNPIIQRGERP